LHEADSAHASSFNCSMRHSGPLDVLGTGVTVSCSPLPSRHLPGEEMIVCTGSAAEMCGRERSHKCDKCVQECTHADASVCKLVPSICGGRECYLAFSLDTCKSLSGKPIYRIRRCCNSTSEYSPICCIGLTLIIIMKSG